ncbi:MAG: 4-amino-4-deoxy-L-arabinose transferase-like glycosyltransferase [Planctomycetota bacterium]
MSWLGFVALFIITPVTTAKPQGNLLHVVLALFVIFAALHAVRLPLFEGPDEPDNLSYIRYLHTEGHLTDPTVEVAYELEQLGRGHMPPLWFLSMVPFFGAVGADDWEVTAPQEPEFYRRQMSSSLAEVREAIDRPASRLHFKHGVDESNAFKGAGFGMRFMRWLSIPWALVALIATWLIAARITGDLQRATWVMALGAFLPQFQHLSGTITMDVMLAAWGALTLFACVEWCAGEGSALRWAILAGVSAALASLTKLNGLVLVPACFAAAAFAWRTGRGFTRPLIACAISFLVVAGPYYIWGWIESGHPLWSWRYQQISPFHTGSLTHATSWGLDEIAMFTMSLFLTWLADFGWTAAWFPAWVVVPFGMLTAVGVAGSVLWAFGPAGRYKYIGGAAAAVVMSFAIWMCLRWIALGREEFGTPEAESTAALILCVIVLLISGVFAAGGTLRRKRVSAIEGLKGLPQASVPLGFLLTSACLILAAEVWFNLKFAQPQARHLYPFFPALIIPVAMGLERVRLLRAVVLIQLVLCVAAFPALIERMRFDGWNSSTVWAATDIDRRADPALTDDRDNFASVDWIEPANRSRFGPSEAPTLLWQVDSAEKFDVVIGLRPELENRRWHPDGVVFRAITVLGESPLGSLPMPDDLWRSLVPGTRLFVQVIALGSDGTATGRSTVREFERSE